MALTIEEANAVNWLLEFFLLPAGAGPVTMPVPSDAQALSAARLLVDHANRKLMAGLRPEQVTERWPGVPF